MKLFDLFGDDLLTLGEDGRIVRGVNTTVDVDTDEIRKQSAKFGFDVTPGGVPPLMSKDSVVDPERMKRVSHDVKRGKPSPLPTDGKTQAKKAKGQPKWFSSLLAQKS